MRKYLLDTSIFLSAKNYCFGFEFCPGFWDWIQQMHRAGRMHSVSDVKAELGRKTDHVREWSTLIDEAFFLPQDMEMDSYESELKNCLLEGGYSKREIAIFMSVADSALVLYGKKHNFTVVTHEAYNHGSKVKIPNACEKFGVPCCNIYEVLRRERPALVLEGADLTLGMRMRASALQDGGESSN